MGLNFDELKFGGLHKKQAAAACNLGIMSGFAWKQENRESL
jgi:hypothetical protein